MKWFSDRLWFWLPIAPLLAFDLWSKYASFAFLGREYPAFPEDRRFHDVWSGDALVQFQLVSWRNTGTIWGLGQDWTGPLIGLRCVALLLIIYFAVRLPRRARLHHLVLGMIMAGAMGNLYDNLTEVKSGVRDFLLFSTRINGELWSFPAFNVADSCICVGAFALAILLWRTDDQPDARPAGEGSAARPGN